MDNILKVSRENNLELTDIHAIKILLCYLLKKLERPITPSQLHEIAVGNDVINYFYYTEAINELIINETILLENLSGEEHYVLAKKGFYGTEEFVKYVPKSFRDKLLSAALKYFAKMKRENEVKCEFIELNSGYYLQVKILDIENDLLNMKIFAPDLEQATLIKDKIMLNPTDFYAKIIGFALDNIEDEPIIE